MSAASDDSPWRESTSSETTESDRQPVATRSTIPPGMLAGALVSAERPPITGQISPASGKRSGSGLGSRERVGGRPTTFRNSASAASPRHWCSLASMSCAGPKRGEVLRDAVKIRGPVAVPACSQSPPHSIAVAVCLRFFVLTNPHRNGNRSPSLRRALPVVCCADDDWSLGGHRAIVGRSPDRERPPLTQNRGMLPSENAGSGGVGRGSNTCRRFLPGCARSEPAGDRLLGMGVVDRRRRQALAARGCYRGKRQADFQATDSTVVTRAIRLKA